MNIRKFPSAFIGVALFIVVAFLIVNAAAATGTSVRAQDKKIVVYYFHGEFRCHTCLRIEELTKKAVSLGLKKELAGSPLQLRLINIDKAENRHFVNDYKLETKSVIIAEFAGSKLVRWKNLPQIWDYHSDEAAFITYIQGEIKKYL